MWDDDEPGACNRDISPEAFMEELCTASGGYGRFFRTLVFHYMSWWAAIVGVPALFLDHHRCEVNQPWVAWLLYCAVVLAMLALAVLLELSVVQRLGLFQADELFNMLYDIRWRLPLIGTVLWKLDTYTDIVFIFIARDCGSSLWWASLATFVFGVVFGQLLLNMCFACTDCDHELPSSFGFVMLDFKLVNAAIQQVLPFDPDVSHLPVARPVTLRTASRLIGVEKIVGDIAQVSIQGMFLSSGKFAHGFVVFSVIVGILHCVLSFITVMHECVQDERAVQSHGIVLGTALQPPSTAQAKAAQPVATGAGFAPSSPGSLLQNPSHPYGSCSVPPSRIGNPASSSSSTTTAGHGCGSSGSAGRHTALEMVAERQAGEGLQGFDSNEASPGGAIGSRNMPDLDLL